VDKQKKLKIALPVLFVVMAFVWGPILFGSGNKDKGKEQRGVSSGLSNGVSIPSTTAQRRSSNARTAYKDWGQNPFMLKRTPKELYLEGIMWDEERPQVIINGEILSVGSTVEDKTILIIRPRSVIVGSEEGEIELNLNE